MLRRIHTSKIFAAPCKGENRRIVGNALLLKQNNVTCRVRIIAHAPVPLLEVLQPLEAEPVEVDVADPESSCISSSISSLDEERASLGTPSSQAYNKAE